MEPLPSAASPPAPPTRRYDHAELLERYFRDHGWSVRVPRSLKELAARVDAATEALFTGRLPTVDQLARRLDTDAESILEARQLRTAHRATSLNLIANGRSCTCASERT